MVGVPHSSIDCRIRVQPILHNPERRRGPIHLYGVGQYFSVTDFKITNIPEFITTPPDKALAPQL